MIKTLRNICLIASALVFLISVTLYFTVSWESVNQVSQGIASGQSIIDVEVELNKLEKSLDSEKTISGTVFYLFKSDGTQIGGSYVTDENGKIKVSLKKGEYYFEEITPSPGYTFDENPEGIIKKYPFTVNGKKDESISITAYNQRVNGSLIINKTIENVDGSILTEEQLNTEFTFEITFSDEEEYSYTLNNQKNNIKSGETLILKHGETAVFDKIPVGTLYNITEKKQEGYITNSSNHRGNITKEGITATFVNKYDPAFIPNDEKIKISITKILEGEYLETEKERQFEFSLFVDGKETNFSLKHGELKEFEIPKGSIYEVKENNYFNDEYVQKISNGLGVAYQDNIEVIITNTFIGEVKKIISGEKTWKLASNVQLPDSIKVKIKNGDLVIGEKEVKKNNNNKWLYEFIVPKYDNNKQEINYTIEEEKINGFVAYYNGYNITNIYTSPIEINFPLIYKKIEGKNAPKTEFEFLLSGKGMPMPEGSENGSKIISKKGESTLDFGKIKFENPGVYTYTVSELNGGVKGWTYDEKVYTVKIIVTEENGQLKSNIIWDEKENDSSLITFTNTYDEEVLEDNFMISGTITWDHGKNPKDKHPNSVIVNVYANDRLVIQKQVTQNDKWKFTFELPKHDPYGRLIIYTVNQTKIDNYTTSVIKYNIHNKFISSNVSSNPQTGDNVIKYFVLTLISGITLIVLSIISFKKRNKTKK